MPRTSTKTNEQNKETIVSPTLIPLSTEQLAELKAQIKEEVKEEFEAEQAVKQDKQSNAEKNLEAKVAAQEKTLKQRLAAMPKVPILIPEDPNNPDDVVPVGWNGIVYAIPRGRQFMVPKPIYDIWKESYTKTQEVNKRIRESVNKEIKVI